MPGIRGVLLDVDGVLVTAWKPMAGAIETVDWLRRSSLPFRLVTNTTLFGGAELARLLREEGMDIHPDEVLTATNATGAYLRRHHPEARCYLLATGQARDDLACVTSVQEGADVVVVGDAEQDFTYENLNRAFRMVMNGAALVAMHRGMYWMTMDGPTLDAGTFVAALELAAGVKAEVAGKPSPEFFVTALESIGFAPHEVMMVGDDVQSDVNAARQVGMHAALVRTGKFRQRDLELLELPAHVIDSISDLRALLS
jgi:HAD superfamily hydrolase (TIGR01458 family)